MKEGVLSLMMLIQQTCHYIPSLLHCAVLLSVQCLQSVDQLHPELLLLGTAIYLLYLIIILFSTHTKMLNNDFQTGMLTFFSFPIYTTFV